jgi:hypothetical protein
MEGKVLQVYDHITTKEGGSGNDKIKRNIEEEREG